MDTQKQSEKEIAVVIKFIVYDFLNPIQEVRLKAPEYAIQDLLYALKNSEKTELIDVIEIVESE